MRAAFMARMQMRGGVAVMRSARFQSRWGGIEYESRGASCPQPRRYLQRRVDLNPMLFIAGIHYVVPPFRAWRAVKLAGGLSQ